MSSNYLKFSGKCKWPRLQNPDEYGKYQITLYLDDEGWVRFDQSGIQSVPKEDDKGRHVTFRRPTQSLIKGETVEWGPPEVVGVPEGALLGNDSDVTIEVVVYDTIKGKGSRLNKVTVDKFVEFVPTPQETPDVDLS